jgi:cytochrome P450
MSSVEAVDTWTDAPFRTDPVAAWEQFAGREPFRTIARGGYWIVTRPDDVAAVLDDSDAFTICPLNPIGRPERPYPARLVPMEVEPPEHAGYRRALMRVLSPPRIRALEPVMVDSLNELIDGFVDDGEVEAMSRLAQPYPTMVFLPLIGAPLERWRDFVAVNDDLLRGPTPEVRAGAGAAIAREIGELVETARGGLHTGLLSEMLAFEIDGRPITDDEVMGYVFGLWLAALDTVSSSLGFFLWRLADDPALQERIRTAGPRLDDEVEYLLNRCAVATPQRTALCDVELDGVQIAAGDRVQLALPAANVALRDRWDGSGRCEQMTFGAGRHYCAGTHLARAELTVAMRVLHERLERYWRPEGSEIPCHAGGSSGPDRLALEFVPTRR